MTRALDPTASPAAELGPELALLPSPVLGANVWTPVADRLAALGLTVHTPAWSVAPQDPDDVIGSLLAALPHDRGLVLVPHSNAGLYIPVLADRLQVLGTVFVDAGLPPSKGSISLATPSFYDFLETLADESGLLPPWTRWWPPSERDALFPDAVARAEVEQQAPRLPLSYYRQTVPVPPAWAGLPCGYLAFGATYAEERGVAVARGWPTSELDGKHLHMLVDPNGVAAAIIALVESLGLD
jgi:hypothetical protein